MSETRWFTREQILALMEALADVDATVKVSCWRCAKHWQQQFVGKRGDWTGPYRYEMSATFPGGMKAEDCVRLAEVVRTHGAEATLWEDGNDGGFHISPVGLAIHFDEETGAEGNAP